MNIYKTVNIKYSPNILHNQASPFLQLHLHDSSFLVIFSWSDRNPQLLSRKDFNKIMHTRNGNRNGKLAITVGYWNCGRGLLDSNNNASPKLSEAESFISDNNLDILAIAEAGLHGPRSRTLRTNPLTTSCIERELRITGFSILLPESWRRHDTARIFMYIRDDINFKLIKTNASTHDLPLISIEAKKGKHATTIISTHYREFTGGISGLKTNDSQLDRLTRLTDHWKSLSQLNHDLIIVGDTNLCYRKWSTTANNDQNLINKIKDTQTLTALEQVVDTDTRIQIVQDRVEHSIIDHTYTNCSQLLHPVEVKPAGSSDHLGLVIKKMSIVEAEKSTSFRIRNHEKINDLVTALYLNDVRNLITGCDNLEDAAETFRREVVYYSNIHIPIKTLKTNKKPKQFIKPTTKELLKEKDKAYKTFKHSNSKEDLEKYKKLSKRTQKAVHDDKLEWLSSDLQPNSAPKEAWSKAKTLLGQSTDPTPHTVEIEGTTTTDPLTIANAYGELHKHKITSLGTNNTTPPTTDPALRLRQWLRREKPNLTQFSFKKITHKDLLRLLTRLKPGRSLPSDTIDGATIKAISEVLLDAILHIINLSLTEGTFGSGWKEQIMSPRHKKGSRLDLENYRPVCSVVELGKLTEMAAHDQIRDHFISNNLFHDGHHGTVPNHDTTTALINIHDFNLRGAEDKMVTGMVLLDQTSAFDLINHKILVSKLKEYKFDQAAISWFTSYLASRSYRVKIGASLSYPMTTGDIGVPQGSILGSLLFVIGQNDLPAANEQNDEGQSTCFVDDETEQERHHDPAILQERLQQRINNSVSWLDDNRMSTSPSKSKLLIIMTKELRAMRHPNLDFTIKIHDLTIKPSYSEKLLGVLVNQDMTWNTHLWGESWREEKNNPGLIPTLLKRLSLIRYLAKISSRKILKIFVPGMILSKMYYALPLIGSLWGLGGYCDQEPNKSSFTKNDLHQLHSINRSSAIITTYYLPHGNLTPTATILEDLRWLSVHQTIAYCTIMLLARILRTMKPSRIQRLLTPKDEKRITRNKSTMTEISFSRLNITKEGFVNQASRLCEMLPPSISEIATKDSLKSFVSDWVSKNIVFKP